MIDVSVTQPMLFVPRAKDPAMQGRWLTVFARFQDALLYAWLAYVSFVPQTFSSLFNVVGLVALWVLMVLMGAWHLVKVPARRGLAAWVIVAFPLAFSLVTVLDTMVDIPIVGPPAGHWLFFGALSAIPLYWLARWLLRTTSPQPNNPVRMRVTTTILFAVVLNQMLLSFFLAWVLSSGSEFQSFKNVFGDDWYANLLHWTMGSTLLVVVVGVPYAVLGFLRGSGHRGVMLGILLCIGVTVTCMVGIFGFIAVLSVG